jgi:hypothetical protein
VLSAFSSNHVLHWGSRDYFMIIHHLLILDDLRHGHRWISAMLHGFHLRVVPRLLEACV